MTVVVEDGTGISGADSVVSHAEADTFLTARGITLSSGTWDPYLLQAMDVLINLRYRGTKVYPSWNDVPFPRSGVVDPYGYSYETNEIPTRFKHAQIWLAYHIQQGDSPTDVATPEVRREKVDVIEVEYAVSVSDTTRIDVNDLPNVISNLKHLITSRIGRLDHA